MVTILCVTYCLEINGGQLEWQSGCQEKENTIEGPEALGRMLRWQQNMQA